MAETILGNLKPNSSLPPGLINASSTYVKPLIGPLFFVRDTPSTTWECSRHEYTLLEFTTVPSSIAFCYWCYYHKSYVMVDVLSTCTLSTLYKLLWGDSDSTASDGYQQYYTEWYLRLEANGLDLVCDYTQRYKNAHAYQDRGVTFNSILIAEA